MSKTIVALYDDIAVARQVIEDLVNANFERSSISLIINDAHNHYSHYLSKDYVPKEDAVTAGEGARFGSVVGALAGLLIGAAALTIPGVGLAIAAGPVVGALTGILAGAITGGITGALVKSGVPEDEAPYYAEGIRRGGTLISLKTSDTLLAEDIMNRNGSTNIHERINVWRQEGWKGFDADSIENADTEPSPVVMISTAPSVVARAMPAPRNVVPLPVRPLVEEEAQIAADTASALPVMAVTPATDPLVFYDPAANELPARPVLVVAEQEAPLENEDTANGLPASGMKNHPTGG